MSPDVSIASADAEPENLYTDGAGAFEFERTASRLREMQSADWGLGVPVLQNLF